MDSSLVETGTKIKGRLLVKTASVCPVCLARIPAERVAYGDEVYLEKTCPQHGFTRTILWRGSPEYGSWMRDKIPNHPTYPFTAVDKGCPFDCGLCADHRQQPCCVLLEVTQRCDLGCPVCFASSEEGIGTDTDMQTIELSYQRMLEVGGPFNIQLSGGEPCVRNDLAQVIEMGREMGFTYFQVNTNGLRIARDPAYLDQLKEAGLQVVYLQFDGTNDAIYERLRGRRVLQEKIQAEQASDDDAKTKEISPEERDKRCTDARKRYETLMLNFRIYEVGPDGARRYLDSAEIDAARIDAKKVMDEFCGGQ